MARRHDASSDADDEDDEAGETPEPRTPRHPARSSSRSPPKARRGRPRPIKRWSASKEEGEEEEPKPPIFWRARDSLYFGPLVALMIVVVLIVGLYAYTQNWPPVYVVESESMQHGDTDGLGLINTGDLVLAQKVPTSSIQPYVVGLQDGYSTYGEPGDVLLYLPDGQATTPIIHRAIVYLQWDPQVHGYNATGLGNLPCGSMPGAVYATPGTTSGRGADCGTTGLTGTLDLFNIGWVSANLSIDLSASALGQHSGFLTMGDNNFDCPSPGNCIGEFDQMGATVPRLSSLVSPAWIVGVARGMIPWFGAIKLWIEQSPTLSQVPAQSWQFLGLTLAGLVALAFGLHFALRAEGVEDPRRKALEAEARARRGEADSGAEEGGGGVWHRLRERVRFRHDDEEDEGDSDETEAAPSHRKASGPAPRARAGRPAPRVRRPHRRPPPAPVDESDDE